MSILPRSYSSSQREDKIKISYLVFPHNIALKIYLIPTSYSTRLLLHSKIENRNSTQ